MDVSMNGVAWSLRSESVQNNKRDVTATAAPESAYSSSTCAKKATSCQWMTTVVKSSQQLKAGRKKTSEPLDSREQLMNCKHSLRSD